MSRRRSRRKWIALLFLAPHLAGVLVFYLLPFLWTVVQSFITSSGFGLSHYTALANNEAFKLAVRNTLLLSLLTVPLLMFCSLAIALYVYRFTKSGAVALHAFVLNYAFPTVSIAYIWTFIFGSYGFLNVWINERLGIPYVNWLDGSFIYVPVVTLFLVKYCAYPIFIFLGGLQALPKEAYEAASIDGASRRQQLMYLTLPLLKPEILFVAVLGFFFNFKLYKEAYILFGAYPPKSLYLIQHFLSNHFQKLNMDTLTTSATVMSLILAIIIYLLITSNRSAYFRS